MTYHLKIVQLILLNAILTGTLFAQRYDRHQLPSILNVYPVRYPMTTPRHSFTFKYDTLDDGGWLQFYELNDGTFRIARVWSVVRGKQVGKEYVFDLSGLLERIEYFNESEGHLSTCFLYPSGQAKDSIHHLNGTRISWYENGNLKLSSNNTGQTSWYPNGQKEIFRPLNNMGQIDGEVSYWNEDGRLKYLGEWKAGIPTENQRFCKRGDELKSTTFKRIPKADQEKIRGYPRLS